MYVWMRNHLTDDFPHFTFLSCCCFIRCCYFCPLCTILLILQCNLFKYMYKNKRYFVYIALKCKKDRKRPLKDTFKSHNVYALFVFYDLK